MKKISIIIILLFALSSFVFAAQAQPSGTAISLSLINQDPDPVQPGGYVDVKFRVENLGDKVAESVKIEFIEGYPFSLNPGTSPITEIGVIGPIQKDDFGVIIEYRLKVARDAVEGNNKLNIKYSFAGSKPQNKEFNVEIKTLDSGLTIESVSSNILEPGVKGIVAIKLENPSDSILRDVTIQLDLSSKELPIAPIESATSKKIALLGSGNSQIFEFSLVPYSDALAKVYKIPVKISYYDSLNIFVEKSEIIGIIVGTDAELITYVESSSPFDAMNSGELSIEIVNKGLIDIKFLEIKIQDGEDYAVTSQNAMYVGNVDSDDYENEDFTVKLNSPKEEIILQASLSYKDANNKNYQETVNIPVKINYTQEGGKLASIISMIFTVIGLILAIPLLYLLYKIIAVLVKLVGKLF